MDYMTRAMKAKDPRFARILARLGHKAPEPKEDPNLVDLRREYEALTEEKADARWSAKTLLKKIAEASE